MLSKKTRNYSVLKRFSRKLGIDVFGVADIRKIKQDFSLLPEVLVPFTAAVSLGSVLSDGILGEISDAPTRLYFHHYRSVNYFLDQAALRISGFIRTRGSRTLPIPASQIVDWQKQTAHLSHKALAVRAGLGWIGRNNLLVHKRYGSKLRLVTVLTDLLLKTDNPVEGDCGKCMRCVDRCPAHAIQLRSDDFDHLKCYDKLREFQKRRIVDQYICGVCVQACEGRGFKKG